MKGKVLIISLMLMGIIQHGYAQVFGEAPTGTSAAPENNPFANLHQKWTPMMQKLFQQVKNDGETVTYYVGAEVGSAFETEDFKYGKVFYQDEDLGDFYYRYNIFSREIEVKKTLLEEEKHKALIRDPDVVLKPSQGALKYQYLSFTTEKGENSEGYLILIHESPKYKLYKFLETKFSEAIPAANSMVNPKPSKFTLFTDFYLQNGDSPIVELPTKKNKLLANFNTEEAAILKKFIKQERIDLDSESDLVRTLAQLDQ